MTELKPCPFCGTFPRIIKGERQPYPYVIAHGGGPIDYVCPINWMVLQDYSSREKAIDHWNKRAELSEADILAIVNGWLDSERFMCDLSQDE